MFWIDKDFERNFRNLEFFLEKLLFTKGISLWAFDVFDNKTEKRKGLFFVFLAGALLDPF